MKQNYPNGINGFSQQSHPGMTRAALTNNPTHPGNNDWSPYHEEVQFPTPSIQVSTNLFAITYTNTVVITTERNVCLI